MLETNCKVIFQIGEPKTKIKKLIKLREGPSETEQRTPQTKQKQNDWHHRTANRKSMTTFKQLYGKTPKYDFWTLKAALYKLYSF